MTTEKVSFSTYLDKRQNEDSFYKEEIIKKAYYIGAYAQAVIKSSWFSRVNKENTTFRNWLSNQLISINNLDKIFAKAFEYENKLKLQNIINSEIQDLACSIAAKKKKGVSNHQITFAFARGYNDYKEFLHPSEKKEGETNE